MEVHSKIEARIEAIKLATELIKANPSYQTKEINALKMARDIEDYISDGIDLPDVCKNINEMTKEVLEKIFPLPRPSQNITETLEKWKLKEDLSN